MSTVGRLGATSTNEQMRRDLRTTQTSTAYPNGGGPSETERPKVKRAARLPPSRRSVRPCSTGGCTLGASTPSSALSSASPPPWERGGSCRSRQDWCIWDGSSHRTSSSSSSSASDADDRAQLELRGSGHDHRLARSARVR